MNAVDVIDIIREGIWVLIKVAGPVMLVGLLVGVIVSLIQALTQLQEMTLTFIPKILAIFASLVIFMPFMISSLVTFMDQIAARIISLQ